MYYLLIFIFLMTSAPSSESTKKEIAQIDAQVMAIDSIERHLNQNWKVFSKITESLILVQVRDTARWPDEDSIEFTCNVVYDSTGNIVKFVESPFSESGDWGQTFSYYFGSDGRLLKFEYYYGSFVSECTEIFREERYQYFADDGKGIKSTRSFMDEHDKPIDTVGCDFDDDVHITLYRTTEELRKAFGI